AQPRGPRADAEPHAAHEAQAQQLATVDLRARHGSLPPPSLPVVPQPAPHGQGVAARGRVVTSARALGAGSAPSGRPAVPVFGATLARSPPPTPSAAGATR